MLRGKARYHKIRSFWDINEVMLANEHLDIQDDIEWLNAESQRREIEAAQRK